MTQNPEHSHEERVRLKAYEIWLNEGKPEGREQRHWAMAREMIGYEDAHRSTLVPDTATPGGKFQSQGEAAPKANEKGASGAKNGRGSKTASAGAAAKPKAGSRTKKS